MLLILGRILGGVGLFLIGSELLRRGFEESAGHSLRRILADFTDRTSKGIFAGFIVSSAVQSATAVIYTLIGFINAGMLKLEQAVSVVYGANLGKITIVLIIVGIGFKFNATDYALPLVGLGAFLKIFLKGKKAGFPTALVGFGLIFLGIATLKSSITGVTDSFSPAVLDLTGQRGLVVFCLSGMLMTVITQSSTGAIVITLSGLAGGLLTLENALALVIGENFGTISSALIAASGATATAKRLSMAHVIYNSAGTLAAVGLLETLVLTNSIGTAGRFFHDDLTVEFTVFYCLSMGLTLVLMLPFEDRLVRWLKSRFHDRKSLGTPQHFDPNRIYHPTEALSLLHREVLRFGKTSLGMLDTALQWQMKKGWVYPVDLSLEEREMDRLSEYIHWFASRTGRAQQTQEMSRHVQILSMASRHFESVSDLSKKISRLKSKFTEPLPYCLSVELLCEWSESLRRLLDFIQEPMLEGDLPEIRNADAEFALLEDQKIALRSEILDAGSSRQLSNSQTIILIDLIDTSRRGMRDQFRGIYETWQLKKELAATEEKANAVEQSIGVD